MLRQGKSRHWKDILEEMTGSRTMNPQALLKYFKPLEEWLTNYLEKSGDVVGWK